MLKLASHHGDCRTTSISCTIIIVNSRNQEFVVVVYQDGQRYVGIIHIVYMMTKHHDSIQAWQGMTNCKVIAVYLS